MRSLDTQYSAIPQLLIFHLFRRVQEIVLTLSEHSNILADLIVLLKVFYYMGITKRWCPDTVKYRDLGELARFELDINGVDALLVDTLDDAHLYGFAG